MQPKIKAYAEAISAVLIFTCILVAWILVPPGQTRSGLFFLLGIALLWGAGCVADAVDFKKDPEPPQGEATAKSVSSEEKTEAQPSEERLASQRPRFTYFLLACITIVSALQLVAGKRSSIELAGLVKPATKTGEWWRLLSSTYLHVGIAHFLANFGALRLFGGELEAHSSRIHLPLTYLLSALGGSLASLTVHSEGTSVGASGGILGLTGYLLILAHRRAGEVPSEMSGGIWIILGLTAYFGFFGYSFIDNAAHAGGVVTGALIGMFAIPRSGESLSYARGRALELFGWLAAMVLLVGAVWTGLRMV